MKKRAPSIDKKDDTQSTDQLKKAQSIGALENDKEYLQKEFLGYRDIVLRKTMESGIKGYVPPAECVASHYNRRIMNLEDLCPSCPLRIEITRGIKDHIIELIGKFKSLYTSERFKEYLEEQYANAENAISESIRRSNVTQRKRVLGDRNYHNVVYSRHIIWNSERIKVLNTELGLLTGQIISKRGRPKKAVSDPDKPFADFFRSRLLYEEAIKALENARLIEPSTHVANDGLTGKKFAHIMTALHRGDYFIDNKKPSADEQVSIAMSAFKLDISVHTINANRKEVVRFDFIPKASDLLTNTNE